MSDLYQRLKNQYFNTLKKIEEQKDIDEKTKSKYLKKIQNILVKVLKENEELTDEEKIQFLEYIDDDWKKTEVIETFNSDDLKIDKMQEIKDRYEKQKILLSLKKDKNKVRYIDELSDDELKLEVLSTIENEDIINYLNKNLEIKEKMVFYLCNKLYDAEEIDDDEQESLRLNKKVWEYMKNIGLDRRVISHLLANTEYRAVNRMDDDMKKDVEEYLGRSIPEDVLNLSNYEKSGIDLDTIKKDKDVIVSKKQLEIDDLENIYYEYCKYDKENKKKIDIKDFIGTNSPTLNLDYGELIAKGEKIEKYIKNWGDLTLGLKRMQDNLKRNNDEYVFMGDQGDEPIVLQGYNGKYFVTQNGNHRMTMLKIRYLTEIERARGNSEKIKDIDEEFQVSVTSAVDVPKDKEEMTAIILLGKINELKGNKEKIREAIEEGRKVGYRLPGREDILKDKEELLSILDENLKGLNNQELEALKNMFSKMNIKDENREYLDKLLEPEKNKMNQLIEKIKFKQDHELMGKIDSIKSYQEYIEKLGIEKFGKEELSLKAHLKHSLERFEEKIEKVDSIEEVQKIVSTMEDIKGLNGIVDGINSNLYTKYQESLDKKVQELIKNDKIVELEQKSSLLRNTKIGFLEKIFGKKKLIDERIESLFLQKNKLKAEEIEVVPDEKRSIENLINYCNENRINSEIEDFLKNYSEICQDESIKMKVDNFFEQRKEKIKVSELTLISQEKIPLFQIGKETSRIKMENEEQLKEIYEIKSKSRVKEKFSKSIKIEESEGIKRAKELAEKLEKIAEVNETKTIEQENER